MTVFLDELAWHCWNNDKSLLITEDIENHSDFIAAVSNGELKIHDNNLCFSDEQNLIKKALSHLTNKVLLPILDDPNAVFSALFEVWRKEIPDTEKLSGFALAYLHNKGLIDLIELATAAIPSFRSIFDIIHILESAIPLAKNIKSDSLFRFAKCTHDNLKRDLMGGRIYEVLMAWLVQNVTIADEIIKSYIQFPEEETATLYRGALIVASNINLKEGVNLVVEYSKSNNYLISAPAIDALGFFQYTTSSESDHYFDSAINLATAVVQSGNSALLHAASTSLWRLVQQRPSEYQYLQHLIEAKKPETHYALSQFMFFNVDKYSEEAWFRDVVHACVSVSPNQKGIIDNLDMVLSSLLKKDNTKEIAISFLEKWIVLRSNSELKEENLETLFNSTFYEIIRRQLLSHIFTRWMFHESKELANGASQLIHSFEMSGGKELSYDMSLIDEMDTSDIVFLVRRTIGYVFQEGLLHSLIWSLTNSKTAADNSLGTVHELFTTRLGYDYPSFTIKFIEEKLEIENLATEIKLMCNSVILSINNYQNELDSLPKLTELKPSHSKVRLFEKERQKQMYKASEAAQEKSVLSQLVTTVHLKAGRSSFSRRGNSYSEKMHLSSHSYSITIPRSEVIDPVGSERERLIFRNTKKVKS